MFWTARFFCRGIWYVPLLLKNLVIIIWNHFQICFGCAFLDRFSGSNSNISTQHETIGNLGQAEAATLLAKRGNKQEEIEVELVEAACPVHTTHVKAVPVGKDTQNTTSLWMNTILYFPWMKKKKLLYNWCCIRWCVRINVLKYYRIRYFTKCNIHVFPNVFFRKYTTWFCRSNFLFHESLNETSQRIFLW